MPQKRDATGRHPFDHENVAAVIEASVVRVNELAGLPHRLVAAHREFAITQNLLRPFRIVTQVRDQAIVFVEQRQSAVKIGDEQHIAANFEVRREDPAACKT